MGWNAWDAHGVGTGNCSGCVRYGKRKTRRTDPFVVGLVENFVDGGDVEPSVDPVDAIIGKEQEAMMRAVSKKAG